MYLTDETENFYVYNELNNNPIFLDYDYDDNLIDDELLPNEIKPFTFDFIKTIYQNMLKIKNDDEDAEKIYAKIQLQAQTDENFEILIQLIQSDIVNFSKYLTSSKYYFINKLINKIKQKRIDSIAPNEPLVTDDKYNMYTKDEITPLGENKNNNVWKDDYVLLNTDRWLPPFGHNKYREAAKYIYPTKSYVAHSITSGYPVNVKDFDIARKVLPPDNININYIKEKLNAGVI